MGVLDWTAVELGREIKAGRISVVEATEAALAQIEFVEPFLHAFIQVDREGALKQAKSLQSRIKDKTLTGPLAGVPMAVKDNLCIRHQLTTCGSGMLSGFRPSYTAEALLRLKQAGAVILGKTNMDEFGMGSTTETSAFGPTKNPWNLNHVPGGSSGGSCAAVAAHACYYALGTDTGGSIRQPSAFCGITGIKPTYGRVSRYGLIAYGSSLEQIGPIARDVGDCAAVLEVMAGRDVKDSTSVLRGDMDFTSGLNEDVRGIRIGLPREYFSEELDKEVREAVLDAARVLEGKGAIVEEFSLPLLNDAVPAYYVIACAEASSNLSRFDGVKYGYRADNCQELHEMYKKSRTEGFGKEVKRRIMLGTFVLSSGYYDAYYLKALQVKTLLQREFQEAFSRFDLLLAPAALTTAPKLGETLKNPVDMYSGDLCTVSANLAGLPALVLPWGMSSQGLPIGVQMIGNYFQEKTLFCAGYGLEQMRSYQKPAWIEAGSKVGKGKG